MAECPFCKTKDTVSCFKIIRAIEGAADWTTYSAAEAWTECLNCRARGPMIRAACSDNKLTDDLDETIELARRAWGARA